MATSSATTVEAYLQELPEERRREMAAVLDLVRQNLPGGYRESMDGMINWSVPLERYPNTYNKQPLAMAGLAAQKNNLALYLVPLYNRPEAGAEFREAWASTGKKLDMGKSCIRFKRAGDLAQEVVAAVLRHNTVEQFLADYEHARAQAGTVGSRARV